MIGYFNLLSLSLGIFAWVLTLTYLVRYKKDDYKKWGLIVFLSMSACAISLLFQLLKIGLRVELEDWSGLMDTMSAVEFVSVALVVGTVILNIFGYRKLGN